MVFLLERRIVVFLDDIKKFNESVLLRNYIDSSFMSETYFTVEEIQNLKSMEINGISLKKALDCLFKKRHESGNICSSHDLYPLYMKYFNVQNKSKRNIKNCRKEWEKWLKCI